MMEFLYCVLLLLLVTVSKAAVFPLDFENKLRSFIDVSMKCHKIPGMTVTAVKGNETWASGFGLEDISTGKPVDSQSQISIASVTKGYTATLLGILLEEHGLNWSKKVTEILGPEYGFIDPYRTKELTLRDLLSHRTGLARLDFGGLESGLPKSVNRSTMCKRMKYLPEQRPLRDEFIYSNFMYMMLGHVSEILGNDTWENLMTSRIFQPLGMTRTTILKDPADVVAPNVAKPYIYKGDDLLNGTLDIYDIHPIQPAAGILTSATDMAKWIKFNLNLGKTEAGKQLLSKEFMEDIRRVTSAINVPSAWTTRPQFPFDDITTGYGYGWNIAEYRGYRKIWHAGGLFSYISLLWTFPDMDVGVYASVNGYGDPMNHLAVILYYMTDQLLELKPWLNDSTACTFPEPWIKAKPFPASLTEIPVQIPNLAQFEGTYRNRIFTDIKVYANLSSLLLNSNHVTGVLHPSSEQDRFVFELTDPWEFTFNNTRYFNVTFQRTGSASLVDGLTLELKVDLKYEKYDSVTGINVPIVG